MTPEKAIDCPNCGQHFPLISSLAVGISRRQLEVLAYVVGRVTRSETPPSYRQISDHLGHTSTSFGFVTVTALIEQGYLEKLPGRLKSVVPTAKAWALFGLTARIPTIKSAMIDAAIIQSSTDSSVNMTKRQRVERLLRAALTGVIDREALNATLPDLSAQTGRPPHA